MMVKWFKPSNLSLSEFHHGKYGQKHKIHLSMISMMVIWVKTIIFGFGLKSMMVIWVKTIGSSRGNHLGRVRRRRGGPDISEVVREGPGEDQPVDAPGGRLVQDSLPFLSLG